MHTHVYLIQLTLQDVRVYALLDDEVLQSSHPLQLQALKEGAVGQNLRINNLYKLKSTSLADYMSMSVPRYTEAASRGNADG